MSQQAKKGEWMEVIVIYDTEIRFAILGGLCVWWNKTRESRLANIGFLSQCNRPPIEISQINNEARSPSKDLLKSSDYIWPSMFSSSRSNLTHQKNLKASLLRLNPKSHSHLSDKILLEEMTYFKHIQLTLKTDSVEKLLQMRSRLRRW